MEQIRYLMAISLLAHLPSQVCNRQEDVMNLLLA